MTARASRSDDTAPVASICMAMLPSAVASTGPAMTGRPVALAVNWFSSRLRDPPPTMRIVVEAGAGDLFERFEHLAVLERQALENRARVAAGSGRLRLAGLAAVRRDRRDHVVRVQEARGDRDRTAR